MDTKVVNIEEKFSKLDELHAYKIIAQMNDYYFKIVKAKRDSSDTAMQRPMKCF